MLLSESYPTVGPISRGQAWLRDLFRVNGPAVGLLWFAAFFSPLNSLRITEEIKYSDVFFLAAAATAVLEAFRNRGAIRLPLTFVVSLPLFLVTGLIGYCRSDDPADLRELAHFIIAAFGLPLVLGWTTSSSVLAVRTVLLGWVAGNSFNAIIVALNKHGHFPFNTWDPRLPFTGRYGGMSLFPNEAGAFCAMVLPLIMMWLFDRQAPRVLRYAAVPLLLLNFYTIQLSGSRAAILGGIAGMLIFGFNWLRAQPVRGVLMIGAGMLVLYAGSLVNNCMQIKAGTDCSLSAWDRLFGGNGTGVSDQIRTDLLREAQGVIEDSPILGAGFHAVRTSHNIFLQIMVSGGVIALCAFVLYLGTVAAWIYQIRPRRWPELQLDYLLPALYGSFVCWVVAGMFQPFTIARNFYLPVGFLLALRIHCVAMAERRMQEELVASGGITPPA